jgi:hypothetical protein
MKKTLFCLCLAGLAFRSPPLPAQEALKSAEEEYYGFLTLKGLAERPTLNYRTLSDSVWILSEGAEHPWQDQKLGRKLWLFDGRLGVKLYGPQLFSSYNTAAPYGQNDGALWQGRGFNGSLSGGVRLEAYGAELTFKPLLGFSENREFEILKPEMSGSRYAGKGDTYGYFWGVVDAPQRFGDDPFFTFDWGDSEIRYTWKNLTLGFGTQAVWLGPAQLNPILHSNNAPSYPKFDFGLRRQPVTIPGTGWYIGDVEVRAWVGRLSESDYFDNDPDNDHTMFHGLAASYAPSFLPGLTLFVNRSCLVPWAWENLKFLLPYGANTIEDQKASFGASWIFPQAGLEIYGELGIDDYVGGGFPMGYIRYPFHTMLYTAGLKKTVTLAQEKALFGMIIFEWNSMEMSQDFYYMWGYSPYFHGLIKQGYTNRGQWLGAGSGGGGNSQYFELRLYYPQGSSSVFIHRNNPDNNFFYKDFVNSKASEMTIDYFWSWKANLAVGLKSKYYLKGNIGLEGLLVYNLILNPLYYVNKKNPGGDDMMHNFSFGLCIDYKW